MQHVAPETKKRNLAVPILAILLAISVGVNAFLLLRKEKVAVPSVIAYNRDEAEKIITEAGFKLGEVTEEDNKDLVEGCVLKQSPEEGKTAEEGSAINIVLAKGLKTVTMPDLTGKSVEEAQKTLVDMWLTPVAGEPVYAENVAPGKVSAQSVAPGTQVDVLSEVVYATCLGREKATVPNLVGINVNDAHAALEQAGLGCDITNSYNNDVPADNVISQSLGADTQVDKGTVIVIDVSMGAKPADKVKVPDIRTYNLNGAIRTIESAGLGYEYSGDVNGTVVSMSPGPGTEVDPGTTVSFTLQSPKPNNPGVGLSEEQARRVIQDNGLGEIVSITRVQVGNEISWTVITKDAEGNEHSYMINPDGSWGEI